MTTTGTAPVSRKSASVSWPRWGWAPYLLLAAFVGYWAATHVGAVVAGAGSWRAVVFGIVAVLLAVVLLVGVARMTRRGWAGQVAGLVPLVVAVILAVLPSYLPSTVNEAGPEGLAAAPSDSAAAEDSGGSADPSTDATASTAPAPAVPVELSNGQFAGIDHEVAGTARLIQLEDGSLLVRFEQFSVEAGPDYDVYVVSGSDVRVPNGATRLGDLKGTAGDQNYPVPADAVLAAGAEPLTVLIWCQIFAVPVANATL